MVAANRTRVLHAVTSLVALVLVGSALSTWLSQPPHPDPALVLIWVGSLALALVAGVMVHGAATWEAAPMLAGVMVSTPLIEGTEGVAPLFALWSLAVLIGYQSAAGTALERLPYAGRVIVAGALALWSGAQIDVGPAPYDRVLTAVVVFAVLHACLEAWQGRGPSGYRTLFFSAAAALYAFALAHLEGRLESFSTAPWPAVATAATIALGTVALAQAARIAILAHVTDTLMEASTTTPWPADRINEVLLRLVGDHIRTATISIEAERGTDGAQYEEILPGTYLTVRRHPGDFGLTRSERRLISGLTTMARASHHQAARERRLWTATVTDELTGVWELDHWRSQLHAHAVTRPSTERIAVVVLDLDHFKTVHLDYGHLRADHLLAALGRRLHAEAAQWHIGRAGRDRFVGFARNVRDERHLDELCGTLAALIRRPVETEGITISMTASIGRVLSVSRRESPEAVLTRAEHDLQNRRVDRQVPEAPVVAFNEEEILRGLLDRGVEVAYQPIIETGSRKLIGWEALLRGSMPLLGALNPEQLVGSAVRAGMLDVITRSLAEQAISSASAASQRLGRRLCLNINLEQEQFRPGSELLRWLAEQAGGCEVDLTVELTERGTGDTWGAQEDALADRLEAAGVKLVLDDLGAGAARLSLLVRRPWSAVKLDRGFLTHGPGALVHLRHTAMMLHELEIPIVMEGVETLDQLTLVEGLGIQHVQGHLFAAAGTAEEMLSYVDRLGPDPTHLPV